VAKYTPEQGSIQLRVEREASQAGVTVTDNGIGIATGSMPQLFDMFSQVFEAAELSEGGLGIGLNLVKRLAEKHGGSVEVSSPGESRGATFTLRLPITHHIDSAQPESVRS
jgi:signal transduction histidine kinase